MSHKEQRKPFLFSEKHYPKSLAKFKPSLEKLEAQIQQKVIQYASRSTDQLRQCFKLFNTKISSGNTNIE